jgi:hypothetical protein
VEASLIITAICGELEVVVLVVDEVELEPLELPPPPQAARLAVNPAISAIRTARLNLSLSISLSSCRLSTVDCREFCSALLTAVPANVPYGTSLTCLRQRLQSFTPFQHCVLHTAVSCIRSQTYLKERRADLLDRA